MVHRKARRWGTPTARPAETPSGSRARLATFAQGAKRERQACPLLCGSAESAARTARRGPPRPRPGPRDPPQRTVARPGRAGCQGLSQEVLARGDPVPAVQAPAAPEYPAVAGPAGLEDLEILATARPGEDAKGDAAEAGGKRQVHRIAWALTGSRRGA